MVLKRFQGRIKKLIVELIKQERKVKDASNKDLQTIFEVYLFLFRQSGAVLIENLQGSISARIAFSLQNKRENYIRICIKMPPKMKYFSTITLFDKSVKIPQNTI